MRASVAGGEAVGWPLLQHPLPAPESSAAQQVQGNPGICMEMEVVPQAPIKPQVPYVTVLCPSPGLFQATLPPLLQTHTQPPLLQPRQTGNNLPFRTVFRKYETMTYQKKRQL